MLELIIKGSIVVVPALVYGLLRWHARSSGRPGRQPVPRQRVRR